MRRPLPSIGRFCVRFRPLAASLLAAALAASCSSPPPTTYDLTAPRQRVGGGGFVGGQVVVPEPVTVQTLEADRIVVKDAAGAVSFLSGGQWADRLPRLIQARLIQTFENASRIRAIARPGERVAADYQLNTELRTFHVLAATSEAEVEISAKVVNDREGKIVNARVFQARVPVASIDAATAARALDDALSKVLLDIVRWVGTGHGRPAVGPLRQPEAAPS